jgi:3-phosphoshikimate 1-carboxyvinyltransferase
MGAAVSRPYLDMTVAMMRRSGAQIRELADGWEVAPVRYTGCERIEVEPDWSGAAFLLACAKVGGFDLEVEGLARESLQGDRAFVEMMQTQWTPSDEPLVVDLTDTPDLIAPLAAMAPFAPRPTHLRGAAHARVKECDRVKVLSEQLARAGVITREHQDGLDIQPLTQLPTASITLDPHDDHRMAMAFGVLSLRMPHIEVRNMACVSKSFPEFWDVLAQIREWIAAC